MAESTHLNVLHRYEMLTAYARPGSGVNAIFVLNTFDDTVYFESKACSILVLVLS